MQQLDKHGYFFICHVACNKIHKHNAYEKDIELQSREFTEEFRTTGTEFEIMSDINTMSILFSHLNESSTNSQ